MKSSDFDFPLLGTLDLVCSSSRDLLDLKNKVHVCISRLQSYYEDIDTIQKIVSCIELEEHSCDETDK